MVKINKTSLVFGSFYFTVFKDMVKIKCTCMGSIQCLYSIARQGARKSRFDVFQKHVLFFFRQLYGSIYAHQPTYFTEGKG